MIICKQCGSVNVGVCVDGSMRHSITFPEDPDGYKTEAICRNCGCRFEIWMKQYIPHFIYQ